MPFIGGMRRLSAGWRLGTALCAIVLLAVPLTSCSSDDQGEHSATSHARASSDSPWVSAQGFILTQQDLEKVKSDAGAVSKIRQASSKLGNYTPHPVAELNLPDHYTSTGTDEESDQGSQDLARDANAAYVKALSYLVTGNTDDASQAQRILDSWATTLQNVGTVQGKNTLNFNGPYLLAAATWVRGVGGWDDSTFAAFTRGQLIPNAELTHPNNHGQWGILLVASSGIFLNDQSLVTRARTQWLKAVPQEIAPDGTLPTEMTRSSTSDYHGGPTKGQRGIAYTHYALLPMSVAAQIFDVAGNPVWDSDGGQRMGKPLGVVAGWVNDPKSFPYYASNDGKLPDLHNDGYFALLLRHYPNATAQQVLEKSAPEGERFWLATLFPVER